MGNIFSHSTEPLFRTIRQQKNYDYYFTTNRFFTIEDTHRDDFLIIDNYINE